MPRSGGGRSGATARSRAPWSDRVSSSEEHEPRGSREAHPRSRHDFSFVCLLLFCVCVPRALFLLSRSLPRSLWPCFWPSFVSRQARRRWNAASRASLLEQHHLFSSVVSLFALNPLVLPALMLGWIMHLSKQAAHLPVVRTLLYLSALGWVHTIILAIRAVMPLCVVFVLWTLIAQAANSMLHAALWNPLESWAGLALLLVAAAESVFYLLTLRRARLLQARTTGPELSVPRRWLAYRRVEQSSQFVLPMAMPECCVHWRKFKHLRAAAHAFAQGSKSFREREGGAMHEATEKHASVPAASSVAEEGVTPSARYLDRSGLPVAPSTLSPTSHRQRHPLDFLRGWFYNVDLRHIKHDNLMAFFAENSMGLHLAELSSKQRAELEDVVSWIQLKLTKLSPAEIRRRQRAKLLRTALTAARGAHDSVVRCDVTQSAPPVICVSPPSTDAPMPSAPGARITAAQFRAGRGSIELPLSSPIVPDAETTPQQQSRRQRPRRAEDTNDDPASSTSPSPASSSGSNSPLQSAASPLPPHRAASTSPDDSDDTAEEDEQPLPISPCASRKGSAAAAAATRRRRRNVNAEEQQQQQQGLVPPSQLLSIPSPSPFAPCSASESTLAADDSASASSVCSSPSAPSSFSWDIHLSQGTLQPGYDPLHPPMSLNLAPVGFVHRPLAIYLGVLGLGALAGAVMRAWGFQHCRTGRISYWYRAATVTDAEIKAGKPRADPLVLIHGIGIGAFTYLHLLRPLCRTASTVTTAERGVYVLELPYISMQLGKDDVPSPTEHVEAMRDMIYEHEMDEREAMALRAAKIGHSSSYAAAAASKSTLTPPVRASLDSIQQSSSPLKILLVSHSYGTFVSTWFVKHRPDMVSAVVLIDPVCFMVYDPTLIYNFIYRTPFSLVTHIYHFFTARELGISYTLLRHFWWYENILWREEIERLGMSPAELENSYIAERDMCVAALPYHDIDQGIREEEGDEAEADAEDDTQTEAAESLHRIPPQQHHRRVRSDGSTMFEVAGSGAPDADALHTPAVASSSSSSSASASAASSSACSRSAFSEHPLCPLRPPGGVRAHVFLASNDDITPSASIHAYLLGSIAVQERKWGRGQAMIRCEVFPGIGHAEALFHSGLRRKILTTIQGQPSDAELRQKALSAESEQRQARSSNSGKTSKAKEGCATPM